MEHSQKRGLVTHWYCLSSFGTHLSPVSVPLRLRVQPWGIISKMFIKSNLDFNFMDLFLYFLCPCSSILPWLETGEDFTQFIMYPEYIIINYRISYFNSTEETEEFS